MINLFVPPTAVKGNYGNEGEPLKIWSVMFTTPFKSRWFIGDHQLLVETMERKRHLRSFEYILMLLLCHMFGRFFFYTCLLTSSSFSSSTPTVSFNIRDIPRIQWEFRKWFTLVLWSQFSRVLLVFFGEVNYRSFASFIIFFTNDELLGQRKKCVRVGFLFQSLLLFALVDDDEWETENQHRVFCYEYFMIKSMDEPGVASCGLWLMNYWSVTRFDNNIF